ncbi:MAG: peptidoglycan -binding protein [Alphaproteobacteria bacterium]|nr:peptidoglycan -binding protein [Alphaproteobacteria bacterium]
MMRTRRPKGVSLDVWPGFVDALATLLIVMIFVLMIFVVSQIYLSDALQGSKRGLDSLQAKLHEIASLLKIEEKKNTDLTTVLQSTTQQLHQMYALKNQVETDLSQKIALSDQRALTAEALLASLQLQIEDLNQKLQALNGALEVAETTRIEQKLTIEALDQKLAAALVQKVEELEKYRSEFFAKLKELLEKRSDVRVVGDRFVFQSEVLFPSGSATLQSAGEKKLKQLAKTLKEISLKMPADLSWVLRVDGHTDNRPIHTEKFASNWELSAARAIAVIKFLINEGIPAEHLAAAGFGEFHPLEKGVPDENNRRIELKLDQR